MMETSSIACPQCRLVDMVQKVTSIVSASNFSGTFSGTAGGFLQGGLLLSGETRSALSQRLAPPVRPTFKDVFLGRDGYTVSEWGVRIAEPDGPTASALGRLGLALLVAGIVLGFIWGPLGALVMVVGLAVLIAGGKGVLNLTAKAVRQAEIQYRAALEQWQQLYYCHRCDGVFIPSSQRLVPVSTMLDFLRGSKLA